MRVFGLGLGLALFLQQGGKPDVLCTRLVMRSSHSSHKLASIEDAVVLLHCHCHVCSNSSNPGCCLRCLQHKECGVRVETRIRVATSSHNFFSPILGVSPNAVAACRILSLSCMSDIHVCDWHVSVWHAAACACAAWHYACATLLPSYTPHSAPGSFLVPFILNPNP